MKQNPMTGRGWRWLGVAALLWAGAPGLSAAYTGPVPAPADAWGGAGPYAVATTTLPSPQWAEQVVTVKRPEGATGPRPVWFFAHGFGGNQPEYYGELLDHLASHGAVVVFSPYPANLRVEENYDIMFAGFAAAVSAYASEIDTTRIGVMGHSYGGGAVPALALRAVREKGWGANGLAMMALAPWFSYGVADADLAALPDHAQFVVQVYAADTMNDHRMAIDLFNHAGVPAAQKTFLLIHSDRIDDCNYEAAHNVPTGAAVPRPEAAFNALDAWGVLRIAQALADSTWRDDAAARAVALGDGTGTVPMGRAPDGRALRPMERLGEPEPLFPSSHYRQQWNGWLNPRYQRWPRRLTSRLSNLSVRAYSGTGDDLLVAGASVAGDRAKTLLVRSVGPGLVDFGVTGTMADPELVIFRGPREDLRINDWAEAPDQDALALSGMEVGAFVLHEGSADAAIQAAFAPGVLSLQTRSRDGTGGVVLMEVYDAEQSDSAWLENLSVRGQVGAGEATLIAGFSISGEEALRVLLRGVGPGLTALGVSGVVVDPRLTVYRDGTEVARNDDWSAEMLAEVAARVGAFGLVAGSADAGLLLTLMPGHYSVHLTGRDAADVGLGLVELYLVE